MTTPTVDMVHYIDKRVEDVQRAVDVAEKAQNERLNGMNEFREQLKSQENTYATRIEMGALATAVDLKIGPLEKFQAMVQGQLRLFASIGVGINILIGAAMLYFASQ